MIARWWQAWVAIWDHHEHPRSLAYIRIGVGLCLLWDFAWIGMLDLIIPLIAPEELGGWGRLFDRPHVPWVWRYMPTEPWVAYGVWSIIMLGALAVTAGFYTRTACLIVLIYYGQTAQILDAADRGIDTMLRNVLVILAFSKAGAHLSWEAYRRGTPAEDVPAWPRHLLILQLVVMYFVAGIAKVGAGWTPMGGYSALYLILQDPAVARFDWSWIAPLYPITQFGTFMTTLWEYTAPLVLVVYYFRHTHHRPGRFRAWSNRYNPHWWWLAVGVTFHVLIAITLNLGIFPFAMLAFYPCFIHPDEWWWVERKPVRA